MLFENKVILFKKHTECGCCYIIEKQFTKLGPEFNDVAKIIELEEEEFGFEMQYALAKRGTRSTGVNAFPRLFIGGIEVGGCKDSYEHWGKGLLRKYLEQVNI